MTPSDENVSGHFTTQRLADLMMLAMGDGTETERAEIQAHVDACELGCKKALEERRALVQTMESVPAETLETPGGATDAQLARLRKRAQLRKAAKEAEAREAAKPPALQVIRGEGAPEDKAPPAPVLKAKPGVAGRDADIISITRSRRRWQAGFSAMAAAAIIIFFYMRHQVTQAGRGGDHNPVPPPPAERVNPVDDIAEYAKDPDERKKLNDALTAYNLQRGADAAAEDAALRKQLGTFETEEYRLNKWTLDLEQYKGFGAW
jgi:hypothetical protein